jgi:hypothetical protein
MNGIINRTVQNAFHKGNRKDYREPEEKEKERAFICRLLNNDSVYIFACTILHRMIQHAKKVKFSDDDIKSVIKVYKIGKTILKFGYTEEQANAILGIINIDEFVGWNKSNSIPLMQIMGAFYRFQTHNLFVKLCIDDDVSLQTAFMNTIRLYFKLPSSMNYDTFKTEFIEKSYGYWFYLWVITYLQSEKKNLMHRNAISDPDYIRMWDKSVEFSSGANISKYKTATINDFDCKYEQLKNFEEKTIIIGNTFMVPRENGLWFNLMRHYKKEIIAGPSSSSVLSYQIIFDITKILEPTLHNKVMLLLAILCHYSEYYHSFSEVLQSYTVDAELEEYTLDMNDMEYIHRVSASILGSRGGDVKSGRRRKLTTRKNKRINKK